MSGKSNKPALQVAHGVGLPISLNASGAVAEWIMLLPSGKAGVIATVDGRGPYRVTDAAKLATASLQANDLLPVDENHATDLAAPKGGASPARGWIAELDARKDGLYGRVEWSPAGAQLMSERAYRFISPVFEHDKAGNITGLLRASLTNTPNLRGMAALHSEGTDMELLAQLRKLLGLADDADEASVLAKIEKMKGEKPEDADAALQTALASIATAAGVKAGSTAVEIATAVTALAAAAPSTNASIVALQAELTDVTKKLNTLQGATATDKATAFVDGAIAKGHVGVKPLRDHYIAMHAVDPARVEKEIGALPIVGASGALTTPPAKDGVISLNAEQKQAARILGIPEDKYLKTVQAEQALAG